MPSPQIVDEWRLREVFAEEDIISRAEREEIRVFSESRHPSPAPAAEPFCTQSQILHYYTANLMEKVAIAHQYLRPGGTVGASGKPDPKMVRSGGVVFGVR